VVLDSIVVLFLLCLIRFIHITVFLTSLSITNSSHEHISTGSEWQHNQQHEKVATSFNLRRLPVSLISGKDQAKKPHFFCRRARTPRGHTVGSRNATHMNNSQPSSSAARQIFRHRRRRTSNKAIILVEE
jgi:hypothetical protein